MANHPDRPDDPQDTPILKGERNWTDGPRDDEDEETEDTTWDADPEIEDTGFDADTELDDPGDGSAR